LKYVYLRRLAMRTLSKSFFSLSLFILIVSGALLIPSMSDDAQAQQCAVSICKQAESSGDTAFPFTIASSDLSGRFGLLGEGEGSCVTIQINQGETASAFEDFLRGWVLDDIECNLVGVDFTITENGVDLICNAPTVNGTCVFVNVRGTPATNIPALSEWGMISAAAGLVLVGVYYALRRRAVKA
jgi:hypothetical protein